MALNAAKEGVNIQERLAAHVLKQFKAGDSTRTDVEVSQARVSQARSQFAEADLAFENAKLAWIQITGLGELIGLNPQPILLSARLAEELPLAYGGIHRWQEAAREQNPLLRAQRAAILSAKEEIKKAQADHLPTADLFASRSYSKSAMDNTIGTEYRTSQIGVQVAIPVFAGGAINSIIRQAEANLRRAQNDHLAAINRLNLQIDRDWRSLEAAKVEAAAQRRTIDALQVVIESAARGVSAGIATRQDEDQASLQLLNSRRDLVRANARALAAWARLMASLGALNEVNLTEAEAVISKP
jgi:outer membrane protein TolC